MAEKLNDKEHKQLVRARRILRTLPDIRKAINDYPPRYDAHNDQLVDRYELCQSVNQLLALLRRVVAAGSAR